MDSSIVSALDLTSLLFVVIICPIASTLLIGYLKSKPLGQQTFLDRHLIGFQTIYGITFTLTSLSVVISELFDPFDDTAKRIIAIAAWFGFSFMFVKLGSVVIIKYLSIYHNFNGFESISDDSAHEKIDFALLLLTALIDLLDMAFSTKVEALTVYHSMKGEFRDSQVNTGFFTKSVVVMDALLIVLLQIRLEIDSFAHEESQNAVLKAALSLFRHRKTIPREECSNEDDKVRITHGHRFVVTIVIIFSLALFLSQLFGLLHFLAVWIVRMIVAMLPLVYFRENANLHQYAITRIKSLFPMRPPC